jgi:hypothetical protein
MRKKKWIVSEENPDPDDYIAVMVADAERILVFESRPSSVYEDGNSAMMRARELRSIFGVSKIKVFYFEGHSETIYTGKT